MRNYGEALKEHRISRGKSLLDVERETGISNQNLSRWERGDVIPSIAFCEILTDYYGIPLDELIGRTDDLGGVVSNSTAPALSAEQREILALYDNLDYMGKKLVRQTLETLNGGASYSVQKKKNS